METVFGFDPASYHQFADQRPCLGIANFLNVVSNLPFLVVGLIGLLRAKALAWKVAFAGVSLVSLGSGYYHLAQDDSRLLWDRLPMTMVFMAVFALIVGRESWLWPLLGIGAASAIWWRISGDLIPYAVVQYVPTLSIPVLVIRLRRPRSWWGVFALYALAKLFENLDRQIFAIAGVSGHTLKHLAAAAACVVMLKAMTQSIHASSLKPH